MSIQTTPSDLAPWQTVDSSDLFVLISRHMTVHEISRFEKVCKLWYGFMQQPNVWIGQFEQEKIPTVEGSSRPYKEDFKILYPMTLSARKMACLGEFIGTVPNISKEAFDKLHKWDPFQPRQKIWQTFQLIVQPHCIRRKYNQELLKDLIEYGDYSSKEKPSEEGDLLIPFSSKNIYVLSLHPLSDHESAVFDIFAQEIYEQCSSIATKVNVTLMRRDVPMKTRALEYLEQEKLLKDHGFEMPSFKARAFFNTVEIINTGSCPDLHTPQMTYTHTSDVLEIDCQNYRVAIGAYVPGSGMDVIKVDSSGPFIGAVPSLNIEVKTSS